MHASHPLYLITAGTPGMITGRSQQPGHAPLPIPRDPKPGSGIFLKTFSFSVNQKTGLETFGNLINKFMKK